MRALVTGASSGLGRELALELASRGHDLLLVARDEDRLAATASAATDLGVAAETLSVDLREADAVAAPVTAALAERPVDLVLHAAGVLRLGSFDTLTDDDWRACFEVNVLAVARLQRVLTPRLAPRARIGIIASLAARVAFQEFAAYGASKWALRGLAGALRLELAEHGHSVTLAHPSILRTPMVTSLEDTPRLYDVFPWHDARRAARRIVSAVERRRPECHLGPVDWLGGKAHDLFPTLTARGLDAWVAWRTRSDQQS
ncbi:MAG: SDR family NAD(P)-dependent oxidoreductase [Acidobacteriota bacterium]